jgi:uncharacterized protein YbjT (DUF2867 family)
MIRSEEAVKDAGRKTGIAWTILQTSAFMANALRWRDQILAGQTMPAAYAEAFINFYLEGALDESPVLPAVAEVTGRAPRTFEEWIAAHREQFT